MSGAFKFWWRSCRREGESAKAFARRQLAPRIATMLLRMASGPRKNNGGHLACQKEKALHPMKTSGKPNLATVGDDDDMGSDAGAIVKSGATLQQTRTQYTGAITVQKERNRKAVLAACVEEARLCGPDFYYNWTVKDKNSPTGKSIIEGTSIDGAMILARNYGNCAVPVQLVADAPQHWIIEATFVDLETGFNVTRLFRQRKNQTTMGDKERMQDIAFQIGQSKAQRNVIVKAMPVWLLTRCFEEAKAVEAEKYKDVAKHSARFVESYAKGGVTKEMLEKKIGRNVASWAPQDIAVLAAIARGIKEGSTTINNEFADEPPEQSQSGAKVDADGVIEGELDDSDLPVTGTTASVEPTGSEAKPKEG